MFCLTGIFCLKKLKRLGRRVDNMGYYDRDIEELLGLTLTDIKVTREDMPDKIIFVADTGEQFKMYHEQDCCEQVNISEIIGDLSDLIGNPILLAESVSNGKPLPGFNTSNTESFTWTFYKFSTIRGSVTIRWLGESNGYYSEKVSFTKILGNEDEEL